MDIEFGGSGNSVRAHNENARAELSNKALLDISSNMQPKQEETGKSVVYPEAEAIEMTDEEYNKKSSNNSNSFIMIAVVVGLIYLLFVYQPVAKFFTGSTIADRLAEAGWVIYYSSRCGWCHRQLKELGDYKYKFECSTGKGTLPASGLTLDCNKVSAVPLWFNSKTGATQSGYLKSEDLEALLKK